MVQQSASYYAGRMREALNPINGRYFNNKEELDQAVYPLFGGLTDIFQGETYMDLVDRMIRVGWVKTNGTIFQVDIPQTVDIHPPTPTNQVYDGVGVSPLAAPSAEVFKLRSDEQKKVEAVAAIMKNDFKTAIQILATLV